MHNYFNYFTEVEEHFIRRRGKNLLIVPLDWCLIELWRDNGIPLHVVLRGIDHSFESAASRAKKSPRTLFYCHPAVIEAFEAYQQARLGVSENERVTEENLIPSPAVSEPDFLSYLDDLEQALSRPGEAFDRAARQLGDLRTELATARKIDWQQVDQDLARIGSGVADAFRRELDAEQYQQLRRQVKTEMKLYKKHLSKEMYARLEKAYLERKILERSGLPEFSVLAAQTV